MSISASGISFVTAVSVWTNLPLPCEQNGISVFPFKLFSTCVASLLFVSYLSCIDIRKNCITEKILVDSGSGWYIGHKNGKHLKNNDFTMFQRGG